MKEFRLTFYDPHMLPKTVEADSIRVSDGAYHFYRDGKVSAIYPLAGCGIHAVIDKPTTAVVNDNMMEVWVSIHTCSGADEASGFAERSTAIAFSEDTILQATIDNEIASHAHMVEEFDITIEDAKKSWKHDDYLNMDYGLIELKVVQTHKTDPQHEDHGVYDCEYTFFKKLVPKPTFE